MAFLLNCPDCGERNVHEFRFGAKVTGRKPSNDGSQISRSESEGNIKAIEFPIKITEDGKLDIPEELLASLPRGQSLRVIILIPDAPDLDENTLWDRLTAEQFSTGYGEADSVYDTI